MFLIQPTKKHTNPKHFVKFTINNIPVNNENISKSSIKVGLRMNGSGICSISKVYKEYTETITYEAEEEVPIEEQKKEETKTEEQKMDTTEDTEKKDQNMDTSEDNEKKESTEENKTTEEPKKEEPKKEEPKKDEKPKTKKIKVQKKKDVVRKTDLAFEESSFSMDSKEIHSLHEQEIKMQSQDSLIVSTQIAKNAVESYANEMKYEIAENMGEYIEEQAKESYNNFLNDTENWLYEDGENVAKSVYDSKLQELKKVGDPLKKRYTESQDRAFYIEKFNNVIQSVLDFAESDDIKHEHITLEERDQLRNLANDAKKWLEENLNIINNQPKHIDPPILCSQIISRTQDVENKSHPIMTKPKPIVEEKKPETTNQQPGSGTEETTNQQTNENNSQSSQENPQENPQENQQQEKMDTTEDKQN